MQSSASALDEAFERMAHSDFELPNGFVNHGPMACEALCVLGLDDRIDGWSRRFVRLAGDGPRPEAPWAFAGTGWHDALGGYRRLPEWIGHFDQVIADDGWRNTVRVWVPRLVPGVGAALFHGVIRTAQAVRAVSRADSSARQAELARSMAYWAARFTAGPPPVNGSGGDAGMELLGAAAVGARCFVDQPTIVNLHGVTGALAVDLLLDHLDTGAAEAAVAQILAEHQSLYPAVIHRHRPIRAMAIGAGPVRCRQRRCPPGQAGRGLPARVRAGGRPGLRGRGPNRHGRRWPGGLSSTADDSWSTARRLRRSSTSPEFAAGPVCTRAGPMTFGRPARRNGHRRPAPFGIGPSGWWTAG